MEIDVELELGEIVYLITDPDQTKRIVTGYNLKPNNNI